MTGLAQARPSLAGVRVLDLTRLLPGNYATLLLYGLGAEVIKVEELTGDGTRAAPPYSATGESGANLVLNRGKTSLALDLKTDEGRALLLRLIASAEVMMDSFRPGVLDRLGLGAAAVAAANPRLVHVSLTAFGDDGPYVRLPTHDLNVQALGGILSLSTDDAGRPSMPALQAADLATGLQAALAVLAGLRAVAQDGQGYRAQVAMADAALALTPLTAGHLAAGTGSMPAGRDLLTGALACYGVYRCADDRWLAVGALEPKFFGRLCELIEHPEFAARQYDLAGQAGLRADLAEVFGARPRAAWVELLAGEDTCVTPVNNLAEAFADANAVERGVIVEARRSDGGAAPVVRAVPWLAEESGAHVTDLGSDAEAILTAVGLDAATVADLRARGIVGGSP